jgi:hypothetical protein
MAKRRSEELQQTTPTEGQETHQEGNPPVGPEGQGTETTQKSKWAPRFGVFGDYEAGVRLIEDRQNRRLTIQFAEKPSEAVRAVLKSAEHGYRFDGEDQVWYKPINPDKPRQSREEADDLVYRVADMIRQEKGLPLRKPASVAM